MVESLHSGWGASFVILMSSFNLRLISLIWVDLLLGRGKIVLKEVKMGSLNKHETQRSTYKFTWELGPEWVSKSLTTYPNTFLSHRKSTIIVCMLQSMHMLYSSLIHSLLLQIFDLNYLPFTRALMTFTNAENEIITILLTPITVD